MCLLLLLLLLVVSVAAGSPAERSQAKQLAVQHGFQLEGLPPSNN
jgi:hypothetical protein